jgi:hypothetical protein
MTRDAHPWQLWAFNLGCIALRSRHTPMAEQLFRESLRICRLPGLGPTVRLMSLLPLAGLCSLGRLPSDLPMIEDEIRKAARTIEHSGFTALLQQPLRCALDSVWREPETFFPFTYR